MVENIQFRVLNQLLTVIYYTFFFKERERERSFVTTIGIMLSIY